MWGHRSHGKLFQANTLIRRVEHPILTVTFQSLQLSCEQKSPEERGELNLTLMTKDFRYEHGALFLSSFCLCAGNKTVFCRRTSTLSNGEAATVGILRPHSAGTCLRLVSRI